MLKINQLKFKVALVLFVVQIFSGITGLAFAVETTVIRFGELEKANQWLSLADPRKVEGKICKKYTSTKNLLFLAEEFREPNQWGYDDYSIVDLIKNSFHGEQIIKSSLSCPDELDGKSDPQTGKVLFLKLDHTQRLPFNDRQFGTIVMRRGLCYCQNTGLSCGGLNVGSSESLVPFFSEVVRVLDTRSPQAIAILHGSYYSVTRNHKSILDVNQEFEKIDQIRRALEQVEAKNPAIRSELVFSASPLGFLVFDLKEFDSETQPSEIRDYVATLRNAEGGPLFSGYFQYADDDLDNENADSIFNRVLVPLFEGVRITVK